MKMVSPAVLVCLVACCAWEGAVAVDARSAATPMTKVIQMLQEMVAKGTAEKQAEEVRFAAFDTWCGGQIRTKGDEVQDASDKIQGLSAKIEKANSHNRLLTDRIHELQEDVARWEQDLKSSNAVRSKEAADFKATLADYSESIEALEGAIETLKKKAQAVPQAELAQVLLQVRRVQRVHKMSAKSKDAISALLDQATATEVDHTLQEDEASELSGAQPSELSVEAPEANAYESQSGGVASMLESLKDEFDKKRYDLEMEEKKAQFAFEGIIQYLSDNIENAKHEIEKKTQTRAKTQEDKAEKEAAKTQTAKDQAEDQNYLIETQGLCAMKKDDFTVRQKLRAEELEALGKAMEIMGSDKVAGAGDKHLPSLSQAGVSFAQLRNGVSEEEASLLSRASTFLSTCAKGSGSRNLAVAAEALSSSPFVKVKKMIKDMISKLMQEATGETEHKGWCDAELATNKATRDQKTQAVEDLTAEKEDQEAKVAQLAQDITELNGAVAEMEASIANAVAERTESKEKNEATIADAKAAQVAVQEAMAVLKDFYDRSAQATALSQASQSPAEDAPETFSKPYQGLMTEGGGVLDFMEVILTDFTRLESETTTEEAVEEDEFKKFKFDSEKDKALKKNEAHLKTGTMEDTEVNLERLDTELKLNMEGLQKADATYEKLKPTCVDSGISYEDRVKRREEEIQSLEEALKIITGTDI